MPLPPIYPEHSDERMIVEAIIILVVVGIIIIACFVILSAPQFF